MESKIQKLGLQYPNILLESLEEGKKIKIKVVVPPALGRFGSKHYSKIQNEWTAAEERNKCFTYGTTGFDWPENQPHPNTTENLWNIVKIEDEKNQSKLRERAEEPTLESQPDVHWCSKSYKRSPDQCYIFTIITVLEYLYWSCVIMSWETEF